MNKEMLTACFCCPSIFIKVFSRHQRGWLRPCGLWVSLKIFEEEDAGSDKVQTKIRRVLRQRQVIPDTIMAAIYSASGKSAAKGRAKLYSDTQRDDLVGEEAWPSTDRLWSCVVARATVLQTNSALTGFERQTFGIKYTNG
jgi:hypothetical protein